jgi:hypothetical protein
MFKEEPDSVVGIATGCGLDNGGGRSSSPGRVENFLCTFLRPALGPTQPPVQWVTGAFSPVVKRPGREVDQSPPANAEVKKMYISTPPYAFKTQCLIS